MAAEGREVSMMDAGLRCLFEVDFNPEILQTLNLHCNHIERIENLDLLRNLKHLDLSSNCIKDLEGLEGLFCLRTLNLSCNQIQRVQGIASLRNLIKLDLSFNAISDISGLHKFHPQTHCLKFLYLHGNNLASMDHVTACLSRCATLKELTLMEGEVDNPLCQLPGYRATLFEQLYFLKILDGVSREGMIAKPSDAEQGIPDLEGYMEYLMSGSSANTSSDGILSLETPKIDQVLEKFRKRSPPAQRTEKNRYGPPDERPPEKQNQDVSSTTDDGDENFRVHLAADHEVRLETLEHKLTHLLHKAKQDETKKRKITESKIDSSTEEEPSADSKSTSKSSQKRNTSQRKSSSKIPVKRGRNVTSASAASTPSPPSDDKRKELGVKGKHLLGGKKNVRDPEDDATYLSLMQELDAEKERRWKAEQAAVKLVDHVKQLQNKVAEEKKLQDTAVAACSRLKQALVKERETKGLLQTQLEDCTSKNGELSEELKNSRHEVEEQRSALKAMEAASKKLEVERIQQQAHDTTKSQEHQMKAAALSRELDLVKASNKQLRSQIRELQELLATREQQHKKEIDGLVKPDSRDIRELVDKEVAKQEARHETVIEQYEARLQTKTREYAALEDEFRMGLTIEANRFQELQDNFEKINLELAQTKQSLHVMTQKESKATGMVTELTAMVKEQKGRITELSRGRNDVLADYKERIQTLELQLNTARQKLTRLDTLEQDKNKLTAQIRAQESVIDGLRAERKLWSQELAQQGASLAQDRGRMEAEIETLKSKIDQMTKQSQDDTDTIKIKAKMVDDQTDTICKLRQKVTELEHELKTQAEEHKKNEASLEDQLASASGTVQELQEKVDSLTERKEDLKSQLADVHSELEKSKELHRASKVRWQEKSEMISRMENQVKEMRDSYTAKENKLVDDRDKSIKAANTAIEKLRSCDDSFRRQLQEQQTSNEKKLFDLTREKQAEIDQANQRVAEVEDEMRQLLEEAAISKKTLEMRIKKLTSAFSEIQNDLI